MRDFANLLKADIALEERMLKMIRQELQTLPSGRLKLGNSGSAIYFKPENSPPHEKAKYIAKHSPLAKGIAQRTFLEKQLHIIENNLRIQKPLTDRYTHYSYHQVLQRLSPVYQMVDTCAREEVEYKRENILEETMHPEIPGTRVSDESSRVYAGIHEKTDSLLLGGRDTRPQPDYHCRRPLWQCESAGNRHNYRVTAGSADRYRTALGFGPCTCDL